MNLSQQNFESELGHYSLLTLSLPPPSLHVFEESKSMLCPPNVVLALDISGSMLSSMQALKSTALATVDALCDGSKIKIVTFDSKSEIILHTSITNNRENIKSIIKEKIINNHGCTNIQDALLLSMQEPSVILFVTDGIANIGLSTSSDLITLSRSLPHYKKCIINTLGLQLDELTGLNAEMLKSLAFDTNGTFRLARDTEGLSQFVGDMIGSYYLKRFKNLSLEAISANGKKGECILTPLTGFSLRVDRPTHIVIKWPEYSKGPFHFKIKGQNLQHENTFSLESNLEYLNANEDAITYIIGNLAAKEFLNEKIDTNFKCIIKSLAQNYTRLLPIVIALDTQKKPETNGASARFSQQIYGYASMGGGDTTQAVAALRAQSLEASLSQT